MDFEAGPREPILVRSYPLTWNDQLRRVSRLPRNKLSCYIFPHNYICITEHYYSQSWTLLKHVSERESALPCKPFYTFLSAPQRRSQQEIGLWQCGNWCREWRVSESAMVQPKGVGPTPSFFWRVSMCSISATETSSADITPYLHW